MTPTLREQVLAVIQRAHPRPLSALVVVWQMGRDRGGAVWAPRTNSVARILGELARDGVLRHTRHLDGNGGLYGLVTACPSCGRNVGPGGTCPSCGEAA